jgi:hypothetical protein
MAEEGLCGELAEPYFVLDCAAFGCLGLLI